MHPYRSLAIVFAFLAVTNQAGAQTPSVESRWDAFHADPVKAMKQIPPKANRKAATNFSANDVRTGSFIQKKNEKILILNFFHNSFGILWNIETSHKTLHPSKNNKNRKP